MFLCFAKVCLSHRSQAGTEHGLGTLQHSLWPDVRSNRLAIWTKAMIFVWVHEFSSRDPNVMHCNKRITHQRTYIQWLYVSSALIKLGRRADNKEGKVTENDVLMGRIVVLLTEVFDLKKSVELERDSKDISTFRREQNPIINHCTEMVLPLLI